MKKLIWTVDKEIVFYENQVEEARHYFGIPEDCHDLEDVAFEWNYRNSGTAMGELIVKEF